MNNMRFAHGLRVHHPGILVFMKWAEIVTMKGSIEWVKIDESVDNGPQWHAPKVKGVGWLSRVCLGLAPKLIILCIWEIIEMSWTICIRDSPMQWTLHLNYFPSNDQSYNFILLSMYLFLQFLLFLCQSNLVKIILSTS